MPKLRCLRCGDHIEEGGEKIVEIYGGAVVVCASCEEVIAERHLKTGRYDLVQILLLTWMKLIHLQFTLMRITGDARCLLKIHFFF